MVATEDYRESACLRGNTHNAQQDTFCEGHLHEHGGEAELGLPSLNGANRSKRRYSQDSNVGYTKHAPMGTQDAEWMLVEPIPPKLATSSPPPPVEAASQTSLKLEEKSMTKSEEVEHLANGMNGTGSHSTPKSRRTSSSSMSLDSKTIYKEPFDHIRYQRPQAPSIESSVPANRQVTHPGVSEQDLKLLLKLRRRVQLLRLQIQGQRGVVELMREAQSDADEQYIKRIRTNHVSKDHSEQTNPSEALALENLWRLCQAARDAYGPAEDSLISMEKRLEVEEARLERIEERFYQRLDESQPASQATSLLTIEDEAAYQNEDDDESSEQGSTISRPADEVDYDDYLWRLGNLDLLQERHQSLVNEKLMLEEEQEKRRRVGMDLNAESLDFLGRFEEILAPVKMEIEEVSKDIERIKQLCIKKGLMDAHGNPIQAPAIDETPESKSQEEVQSELPAEHSKPSQHQDPSGNNEADFRASASHEGFGPFINLWLLHKLRSSALEILLLACYVAAAVTNLDGINWQAEALRLWDKDGAEEATPGQLWKGLESYVTSIPRFYTTIERDKEEHIATAKKTRSLESIASQISLTIKSFLRPKAKSA
jgi:hypothetical protein